MGTVYRADSSYSKFSLGGKYAAPKRDKLHICERQVPSSDFVSPLPVKTNINLLNKT